MDRKATSLGGEYVELDIGLLEANAWNPNQMKDKEFDRLVKEIDESGMIAPIQAVPLQTGKYRIIGGEHRFHACRLLGYETIPVVVLTDKKWADEDLQRLETVRLNIIKGDLNPEKMMTLYQQVTDRYGEESVADLLGFTDEDQLRRIVGDTKRVMKEAGLPKKAIKELDDVSDEIKTVDNLTGILHRIMRKYGSTVDSHFVYFDYGGKKHIMIEVDDSTWPILCDFFDDVSEKSLDANVVLRRMFESGRELIKE